MRTAGREGTAARAIRELRAERDERVAELAAIERALDILERSGSAERESRCDAYHHDAPCEGEVRARWCRGCGLVTRRCDAHGGIRAATHAADEHRRSCPGLGACDPAPEEPERVQGARDTERPREPVSLGWVPVSPAPRGRRAHGAGDRAGEGARANPPPQPAASRPSYSPPPQHPRPQASGSAQGVAVIRRRTPRA